MPILPAWAISQHIPRQSHFIQSLRNPSEGRTQKPKPCNTCGKPHKGQCWMDPKNMDPRAVDARKRAKAAKGYNGGKGKGKKGKKGIRSLEEQHDAVGDLFMIAEADSDSGARSGEATASQ